jgi:hypothetical protein
MNDEKMKQGNCNLYELTLQGRQFDDTDSEDISPPILLKSLSRGGTQSEGIRSQSSSRNASPALSSSNRHPLFRKLPCKSFVATGYCTYEDKCRFIHDPRIECSNKIIPKSIKVCIRVFDDRLYKVDKTSDEEADGRESS